MGMVYHSETLDVYSINIVSIDEDRIHLSVKYYDAKDKISDTARVLIDRKNNVIWIDDERDCDEELRQLILNTIIIQNTAFSPAIYGKLRKELDKLLAHYYEHCEPERVQASKIFPNLFLFFELTKEK